MMQAVPADEGYSLDFTEDGAQAPDKIRYTRGIGFDIDTDSRDCCVYPP